MTARVGAWIERQGVFGVAALGVVVACALFAVAVRYQLPNQAAAIAIDDVGEALAAFVAAAACVYAARVTSGHIRVAWACLGISAALWATGETVWSVYEVGLGIAVPYPGWPDVGFLLAVPFAVAGMRAFWREPRGTASRWQAWLDAAIIALALTASMWVLGLRAVWENNDDTGLTRLLDLAYPAGDIVIVTVLILGLRRATQRRRWRMLLLLGGIGAAAVADSAFSYLSAAGNYTAVGSVLDTGWFAGYLMIALAAAWPRTPVTAREENAPVDLWQLALPWITVLAAGLVALWQFAMGQPMDELLTLITGLVTVLLFITIVLTNRDFLAMLVKSRTSEATLAEIIARAPTGIMRIAPDLTILDANPRFVSLMQSGQVTGRSVKSLFAGAAGERMAAKLASLGPAVDAVEDDADACRGDGAEVWVHWGATAVPNAHGRNEFFIAMFEDTTARHQAEEAAARSLELVQRLNSVKTEFLQTVSHEFKTALIGIQGFSEFMRDADELDVSDARAFAADIHRDAERLDRMVTEMVALDRAETVRSELHLEEVDLNAVVEAEVAAATSGASVAVVTDLAPALPLVVGDAPRLADAMRTLIADAIKYSPAGGTVTVTTRPTADTVTVSVRDQGTGARGDFDNRLFGGDDVYANNPIRKIVGTGLGIGIVRQVIELHGGRLWVERLAGGGSEFRFTLRAVRAAAVRTAVGAA